MGFVSTVGSFAGRITVSSKPAIGFETCEDCGPVPELRTVNLFSPGLPGSP